LPGLLNVKLLSLYKSVHIYERYVHLDEYYSLKFPGCKIVVDEFCSLNRVKIRKNKNYTFDISVDGGINDETGNICKDNGVDILAVGSYLLSKDQKDYSQYIKKLR